MKIEIDFLEGISIEAQIFTVNKYIEQNSYNNKSSGEYIIDQTAKNTGVRIEANGYRPLHVSCAKTKGGTYKFKVWLAV